MTRKGFTLMEVNLAILVMSIGILSILGLYSLGFRENRQSAEDVASAAYADAVISPLVAALSSTNMTWEAFKSIESKPGDKGWAEYFNEQTGLIDKNPDGIAQAVFSAILGKASSSGVDAQWPSDAAGGLHAGLVVLHEEGSAVVRICFRASKISGMLLSAPIYYTEVRFQGEVN